MSFFELVKNRFSCRSYSDRVVEEEKINMILESARRAPSACNFQPISIIVIRNKKIIDNISDYSGNGKEWIKKASVIFVICSERNKSWVNRSSGKSTHIIDAAIVTEYMSLMAADIGLSSCWIKGYIEKEIKQLLYIPNDIDVVALLPVGYATDGLFIKEKIRKDLQEIVHYESY